MEKVSNRVLSKKIINDEAGIAQAVTFSWPGGDTWTVKLDELAIGVYARAAAHGIAQKIGDAAALSRNSDTGQSATFSDKWNAAKAVYDRIMAGEWNSEREGGGSSGTMLARAIAELRGIDVAKASEWLKAKTTAERTALESNPRIKPIIERMQAQKAANVDVDALDDELDGLGD